MARPAVARLTQWLDEGRTVLEKLQQRLHAYDQAVAAVRAAQAERDRLQQQGAALREEVQQLHAAVARLQKERTEAAHWFATMLQEAAVRFPATPPPA
jgi:predicted  nucleic acid-binding Zn-ribbon protein